MINRLKKELETINKQHAEHFSVVMPNNDFRLWHIGFEGAKDTIYEGEEYK